VNRKYEFGSVANVKLLKDENQTELYCSIQSVPHSEQHHHRVRRWSAARRGADAASRRPSNSAFHNVSTNKCTFSMHYGL